MSRRESTVHNMTSRSGSLKGNGRSNTPLTTLKMAVFAPMPRASVSTATAVKPGFFSNWRKANLMSFITQRLNRIDLRGPARGQPAGEKRDQTQEQRDTRKRGGIQRAHAEKQTAQEACQC